MYTKKIVCFANSQKNNGRCIAGKEWKDGMAGDWIRPISNRATHEISMAEQKYEDGNIPSLLDIMEIPFDIPAPTNLQNENHVILSDNRWIKTGELNYGVLPGWIDDPDSIFKLRGESTIGTNDHVPIGEEDGVSLYLVHTNNLELQVCLGYEGGENTVRGDFQYKGTPYNLKVTDPVIKEKYIKRGVRKYTIGDAYLCVSLAGAFKGCYYKVVAAVIYPEQ